MPTVERNVDAETRRAWSVYAASLDGLEGDQYDAAEQEAWAVLQSTLNDLQLATSLDHRPFG